MSKKHEFKCLWSGKKRSVFGLPLSCTKYFITENKIITRTGFLNVTEDEIDIYKITDKKLSLPLFQRLCGCGTITVFSRDTDTPQKSIKCIKAPREVTDILDKQIEFMRDKYNIRGRDMDLDPSR